MIPRPCLPALAAAFLLTAAVAAQRNVLVVLIDDWGTDNSALYATGTNPPPTPRIDALASRGVVFENFWVSAMCSPTRAQLLSGRHNVRTGVRFVVPEGPGLRDVEIPIPEHLRGQGLPHATGAFGKWHLNDIARGLDAPNRAGFDRYAGMFYGVADYYRWDRTVDGVTAVSTEWATSVNVDDALAWIGTQNGPWFCWFAPYTAHSPYQAPPASLHTQDLNGLDPAVTPRPFYRAMVEATDTDLGRLLDGLGPALDDTWIIVMGDNGTPADVVEPGIDPTRVKGTPFESGIRAPLIVSGPGIADPGRRVDALVSAVDLFATVADLVGADTPPAFAATDSVSFAPYLRDPNQAPRRDTIFSELQVPLAGGAACGFQTIREARFKLIRRLCTAGSLTETLHDLDADPLELVDLLQAPLDPDARAALLRLSGALDELQSATPRFERFGTAACSGSAGAPTIRSAGLPRLGQPCAVAVDGTPPGAVAALVIGGSETSFGGSPLPFDLARIGAGPGCALLVSNEIVEPRLTNGAGTASLGLLMPDDPWLLDGAIRFQWLVLDAAANAIGLTTTDALRARLGR